MSSYLVQSQITRSISDAYLNSSEFIRRPNLPERSRVGPPFNKPFILKEPTLVNHELLPGDEFIIFASPWLWKHLSNEAAVDMVKNSSRNVRFLHPTLDFAHNRILCTNKFLHFLQGIATKLIKKALEKGAWNDRRLTRKELKKLNITERRSMHDDISVVVLFLDHELLRSGKCNHLSAISYEASSSQPRTDGDSSSSTDGDSGRQPQTGEGKGKASISQLDKGKAIANEPHTDGDSSSSTDEARGIQPRAGKGGGIHIG